MKENKKYVAFLRGVNVKGTAMKMADIIETLAAAGIPDATAVLATGNILFSSNEDRQALKDLIEKVLSERFSYKAFVFILTKAETESILHHCPFEAKDNFHTYIFVGIKGAESKLMEHFEKTEKATDEKAKVVNGTFYWQVEKGNTLGSSFGKILGKKSLKDQFTSRNINTFEKIISKL